MEKIKDPQAEKKPVTLRLFDDERVDNYHWLNERENPAVIAYLEEENNYLERSIAHLKELRKLLFEEMKDRILPADSTAPLFENGYWYYARDEAGKELPLYCRKRKDLEHPEEIILDLNELALGKEYFQLGSWEISDDNRYVAFTEDNLGRKQYNLRIKDLENDAILSDQLLNASDSLAWANDSRTLFYVVKDPQTLRPYRVMRHKLGTPVESDVAVYEEHDETFEVDVGKGRSGKRIFITSYSTVSTEQWMLDADEAEGGFELLQLRERGLEYYAEEYGDELVILTNQEAQNFRVMTTRVSQPGIEHWKELIPHRKDFYIDEMLLFRDYIVLQGYKNGLTQINILDKSELRDNFLLFEEPAYTVMLDENPETEGHTLRISYSSLITPDTTYEVDMRLLETKMLKRDVYRNYEPSRYVTERLWATARDGVKVPLTLAYRRDLALNSRNPLLLEGYGAYGDSNDPVFSHHRVSLLDRGFVLACAHVRGGHELGRQWYEAGRLLNKKNTFYDFIDCAEYLIEKGYTSPDALFAEGMSAGGLLMGAVANMQPELWNMIIAHVPFVDVITTMLDEELPLTTGEYDEWGDPRKKEFYDYMRSYSPYDNIERKKYPAILATGSLPDSQVQYWEPAKWVAKLREYNTGNNPVYLHTDMHASHFGKSGRYNSLELIALQYAIMLDR